MSFLEKKRRKADEKSIECIFLKKNEKEESPGLVVNKTNSANKEINFVTITPMNNNITEISESNRIELQENLDMSNIYLISDSLNNTNTNTELITNNYKDNNNESNTNLFNNKRFTIDNTTTTEIKNTDIYINTTTNTDIYKDIVINTNITNTINTNTNTNSNPNTTQNTEILPNKVFSLNKLSENDSNYFFKLVNYLKNEHEAKPLLKGACNYEENAMRLLKDCNYDVQACLRKILFPTVNIVSSRSDKFENKLYQFGSLYKSLNRNTNRTFLSPPSAKSNVNHANHANNTNNITHTPNPHTTSMNNINMNQITPVKSVSSCNYSICSIEKNSEKYINSALHDLIGSNIKERENWLNLINTKLKEKVDYAELHTIIDIGNKMKIDIPNFVVEQIEQSYKYSKTIKSILTDLFPIEKLKDFYNECSQNNIRTEEYYQLKESIKKAETWIFKVENNNSNTSNSNKANDLEQQPTNTNAIHYKSLQSLYHEGKSIPVKFEKFNFIKDKYLLAHVWQDKYHVIPKHSKTRQLTTTHNNTNILKEKNRISLLEMFSLIKEAETINFTSNEVNTLKFVYSSLIQQENRILMSLEDTTIHKTKESLTEFLNLLDNNKFNTNLYDDIMNEVEHLEWKNKKEKCLSNKIFKIKHLKSLANEGTKKQLNKYSEVQSFIEEVNYIENWIDKLSEIFKRKEEENETRKDFTGTEYSLTNTFFYRSIKGFLFYRKKFD